jgi:hypothetical protein
MTNMYLLWDILFYFGGGGGNADFRVHLCMGSFTVSFFYFCLCVCKSITLVQSVLIQSFIGEDVLTTLNSGCCWVV